MLTPKKSITPGSLDPGTPSAVAPGTPTAVPVTPDPRYGLDNSGFNRGDQLYSSDTSYKDWMTFLGGENVNALSSWQQTLWGKYVEFVTQQMQNQFNADQSDLAYKRQVAETDLAYERTKFETLYNKFLAAGMSPAAAMQAAAGASPDTSGSSPAPAAGGSGISGVQGKSDLDPISSAVSALTGVGSLFANLRSQNLQNDQFYSQLAQNKDQFDALNARNSSDRDLWVSPDYQDFLGSLFDDVYDDSSSWERADVSSPISVLRKVRSLGEDHPLYKKLAAVKSAHGAMFDRAFCTDYQSYMPSLQAKVLDDYAIKMQAFEASKAEAEAVIAANNVDLSNWEVNDRSSEAQARLISDMELNPSYYESGFSIDGYFVLPRLEDGNLSISLFSKGADGKYDQSTYQNLPFNKLPLSVQYALGSDVAYTRFVYPRLSADLQLAYGNKNLAPERIKAMKSDLEYQRYFNYLNTKYAKMEFNSLQHPEGNDLKEYRAWVWMRANGWKERSEIKQGDASIRLDAWSRLTPYGASSLDQMLIRDVGDAFHVDWVNEHLDFDSSK